MGAIAETVSVMEEMPEETRKEVLSFARYKLHASKPNNPARPHTDEELLSILKRSDRQYHEGKALNMKDAITEARKQHGFI